MARVEKFATWLDHGKTVFDILVALGIGKASGTVLQMFTRVPAQWITPIWLLVSAFVLWVLLKFFHRKTQATQGTQSQVTLAVPQPLTNINQHYNQLDPRFTSEVEASIRQTATQVPPAERENYLYRSLTIFMIYSQFEMLWWNIYASQIKALQRLNNHQLQREQIFPFYTDAAHAYPQHYANYSFDKWLGFMRSETLIREDGDLIGITIKGRDFLKFLLDDPKPVESKIL